MTSRRPPSQRNAASVQQRLARQLQSMVPGTEGGRLASAGPVKQFAGPPDALFGFDGGVASSATRASKVDIRTLPSDGAQDVTLTYVPVEDSWNLLHNRLGLVETEHFTISGRVVSLLSSIDPKTGDTVRVQYDYLEEFSDPIVDNSSLAEGYPGEVMTDSPIAYWRLDEASGTSVTDYTGHGHDGTTANGSGTVTRAQTTLLTAGNGGVRSTKFVGYGARVNVPTSTAFDTANFALEYLTSGGDLANPVWYHPGRMRVLQSNAAIDVFFWGSGAWQHVWRFPGITGGGDSSNHHVIIQYDGSAMECWMDGSNTTATLINGSVSLPSATAGPQFGDGDDGANSGSAYRLQEFAVYGHTLSSARIAAHVAVR